PVPAAVLVRDTECVAQSPIDRPSRGPPLQYSSATSAVSCCAARSSGPESLPCECVRDTLLGEDSLPRDILQRCRSFDWRTWSRSLAYCHPGSRRKTASAGYCLHTAIGWRS